jgi:hypothetical protein
MPYCATVVRVTVIALAVNLLFSLPPPLTGADDLSRGQSPRVVSIAVGNESEPFDCSRLVRRYYNNAPTADFCPVSFTPSFFWFHSDTHSVAEPRKLFQLNVVFLI